MTLFEAASRVAAANNVPVDIVYAQFRHESADGTSQLAREDNNYAGVTSENGGYMHFDSMEHFTDYMTGFLGKFGIQGIQNPEDYVAQLQREGYFGDSYDNYLGGVKAFMAQGTEEAAQRGSTVSDDYSSTDLDFSVLASNHPGDNYLTALYADENSVGLQPHSIYGLNKIGHYINDMYGKVTLITGGAERWTHSGGEHSHHTGDKADLVIAGITPQSEAGRDFIEFCHANGWSCNYENEGSENAHWDIDFTGNDNRDPQTQKQGYTGDFLTDVLEPGYAARTNYRFYGNMDDDTFGDNLTDAELPASTFKAMSTNLLDSVTTSGIANALQYVWGGIAHSGKWWFEKKDPVTQEDVNYVQQALPGDKDAQQFILLNGRDSQEIRWLVNQKLVDRNRQALVEKWKEQNDSILAKLPVWTAGGAGYLLDPLNLIPMGSAIKGTQMVGRLGNAIRNVGKAREIAQIAAKTGYELTKMNAPIAGAMATNDYLKNRFGGEDVNYAYDIGAAMLAGTVLSVAGVGAGKALSSLRGRRTLTAEVAEVADHAETKAYMEAADIDPAKIHSETIGHMKTLHDAEFGKKIGSKIYDRFEQNGRVIATTYEKARAAVSRISGIEIPKDAKAFYVPNEDYTVLITDNIKNTAHVESLLAHEFGVHAGLADSLGQKEYASLMNQVRQNMNKEGHAFNELRRKYDTQDPEEVFAHAVEEDMLPSALVSRIKGGLNKALGGSGYNIKLSRDDVKNLLKAQAEQKERMWHGFYFNDDGTSAFAGVQFSRDNLLNPQLWADFYALEPTITTRTQADIGTHVPESARKVLQRVTKNLEQGPVGLMLNSPSNTARGYAAQLWTDPRGRGLGHVTTLPAEEQKEYIIRRLSKPFLAMADARKDWVLKHKKLSPRAGQLAFDKMTMLHYNAKYGGNKAALLGDVPEEVERAVDALHRFRQEQIEIGRNSARYFGARTDDLVSPDWYEVDHELWRMTDNDLREQFLAHYNRFEDAEADLAEYIRAFAKKDVIREKMMRDIRMENAEIVKKNAEREAKGLKPLETKKEAVSDAEVEEWLESRVDEAVKHHLQTNLDPIARPNIGQLGKLNFLQSRIPMDTSGVMKFNKGTNNEFEFSFDNNLRDFDLDNIIQKNMQRFAGEIAVKNVFHSEKHLQEVLAKIQKELDTSVRTGNSNKSTLNDYKKIEESIMELRGMRPREDAMGKLGALARLALALSYVKNGANMGFAQLGEIGGAIGYGGAGRIFGAVPMLRDLAADIKHGKVTAEAFRDAERHMFGRSLEAEVWNINYQDRVIRDALTERNSISNKLLIGLSDGVQKLGKVTSTLNMLPKMTDSMYRDMRAAYIADAIEWAGGRTFSKGRNPFSKAKLKASHVSEEMAETIKTQLNKAIQRDGSGRITHLDMDGWLKESPESYFKFVGMGQAQAERAIVSGTKQGNKSFLKNLNWGTRMLFQFKDYNLRAINAQTLRAMTAGELDDMIAFGMSIATNLGAYMLRAGAVYAAMKATGMDEKAEEYYKRMFDGGVLMRLAATRSAFTSPLSFLNDAYEAMSGDTTIRTTVSRSGSQKKERTDADIAGDFVSQLPAVKEAFGIPLSALYGGYHMIEGDAAKRDLRALYNLLPIPRFIPFMTYIDHVIGSSDYPDKRPKK